MRTLIGAIAAALLLAGAAHAAQTEGKIKSVDKDSQTITLEDGKSYKLPGEFDADTLQAGMDIVIAYDKVDGQNLITDMDLSQ